jgi:hypothetical protein
VIRFVLRDSRCRPIVRMSNLAARIPGTGVGTVVGEAMVFMLFPELFDSLELLKGTGWVARGGEIAELAGWIGDVG